MLTPFAPKQEKSLQAATNGSESGVFLLVYQPWKDVWAISIANPDSKKLLLHVLMPFHPVIEKRYRRVPPGLLASIGTFELDVAKIIVRASCKRPIKRPGTPDQQVRHATSLSLPVQVTFSFNKGGSLHSPFLIDGWHCFKAAILNPCRSTKMCLERI